MSEQATVRTKICGIRTAEAAEAAARAGADALGFILAPTRRQVTLDGVLTIRSRIDELVRDEAISSRPRMTAVVVNLTAAEQERVLASGAFDAIQYSGDELPNVADGSPLIVVRAIRVSLELGMEAARAEMVRWRERHGEAVEFLVDAHHERAYGGTGTLADWSIAKQLAHEMPTWLAGGLTPDNVAEAIAAVGPFGVDVSSGTELNGVKDVTKIRDFLANARQGG